MEEHKGETNEHLNIHAEDGRVEIIHRYGAAAEIQEPEPVIVSGTIDAPAEYYEKRRGIIDTDKAYLEVNEESGTIILRLDPGSPLGARITGSIKVNPLLELMSINSFDGRTFAEDDFILMLKQTRSLFEDQSDNLNLVDKIKNLEIKVNREIDRKDDERGSKKDYFEQFCEAELPAGFNLFTNVFVSGGFGGVGNKRSFWVDLKYHYKSQLHFWLESPELQDIKDNTTETLMGDIVNRFEDEIPIIYK